MASPAFSVHQSREVVVKQFNQSYAALVFTYRGLLDRFHGYLNLRSMGRTRLSTGGGHVPPGGQTEPLGAGTLGACLPKYFGHGRDKPVWAAASPWLMSECSNTVPSGNWWRWNPSGETYGVVDRGLGVAFGGSAFGGTGIETGSAGQLKPNVSPETADASTGSSPSPKV